MELLADLNEPQRRAVTYGDGPLLVLAGAGSGKTRVITRRVGYLIARGLPPGNVLAITFTNKAAGEMRQRVEQLGIPSGATICTFHSLCARLLREFACQAHLRPGYSIYDQADQLKLVKKAIPNSAAAGMSPDGVLGAILKAKNKLITPQSLLANAQSANQELIARAYETYQQLLAQANAVDFDDLLLGTAMLLRDYPEIRSLLGERYRYIMIDEYQDTNHAQYIIAHGIAMEHHNICATGDPDQSIYAWRGADIGNILEFENDYPNSTVIRLEENYRSTQPILSAASSLVAHNRIRKEKTLWTRQIGGGDVRVVICDDERAEAGEVAERIARHVAKGGRYSDAAVFYRVNALSRVIEEAMIRHGVPYQIARGVEFYNRKETKDVLAYLKLLLNPTDNLSCERIINVPNRGIGDKTQDRLRNFAKQNATSLLDACRQAEGAGLAPATAKKVSQFARMIDELAGGSERSVCQVMEDVVRTSGLEQMLAGGDEDDRQAMENITGLISSAAEFDAQFPNGRLVDYLQRVSLVSDVDRLDSSAGAVTLMTLHAAKGLEFDCVFMVGCEEGMLPFYRSDAGLGGIAPAELEEERRLAFVGMTRARRELTLSCARSRIVRGRTTPQAQSQFISQIGNEHVELEDLTTRADPWPDRRAARRAGFYEDVAHRSAIERLTAGTNPHDWPEIHTPPPAEYEHLRIGSLVRHPKFGLGRLVKISQPWPETRGVVDFQTFGRKTLLIRLAHLELAEEW